MSSRPEFVHLHNHSEYSLMDGITRFSDMDGKGPSELLKSLAHEKTRGMGLSDHGNLSGAIEFYTRCNEVGIKPIIGCELYTAKGSRKDRGGSQKDNCHLTVFARNNEGYQNLMALSTAGFLEGFYYDARIDRELLAKTRYFLEHPEERLKIAQGGYERCRRSGYSYHERLRRVFAELTVA